MTTADPGSHVSDGGMLATIISNDPALLELDIVVNIIQTIKLLRVNT